MSPFARLGSAVPVAIAAVAATAIACGDAPPQSASSRAEQPLAALGSPLWRTDVSGAPHLTERALAADAQGNAYVLGVLGDPTDGRYLLAKIDPRGAIVWSTQFRATTGGHDDLDRLVASESGYLAIGGSHFDPARRLTTWAVWGVGPDGAVGFRAEGSPNSTFRDVETCDGGEVYVAAADESAGAAVLAAFDASGARAWSTTYTGPDGAGAELAHLARGAGDLFAAGSATANGRWTSTLARVRPSDGSFAWTTQVAADESFARIDALAVDGAGASYLGLTHANIHGYVALEAMKLTGDGAIAWRAEHAEGNVETFAISLGENGRLTVLGGARADAPHDVLVQLDAAGNEAWSARGPDGTPTTFPQYYLGGDRGGASLVDSSIDALTYWTETGIAAWRFAPEGQMGHVATSRAARLAFASSTASHGVAVYAFALP